MLIWLDRKVAWSRLGAIAYISNDGQKILVRYLHCKPEDGQWTLSNESTIEQATEAHSGHTLVHICFNETGSDLAIVDSSARISTFSISLALNLFNISRSPTVDHEDDRNQPVGLMWLNSNRPVSVYILPSICQNLDHA